MLYINNIKPGTLFFLKERRNFMCNKEGIKYKNPGDIINITENEVLLFVCLKQNAYKQFEYKYYIKFLYKTLIIWDGMHDTHVEQLFDKLGMLT